MKTLGQILFVLGVGTLLVGGLIVVVMCLGFLHDRFGFFGSFLGVVLGPITCVVVPLWIGLSTGKWTLLAFAYIGGFIAQVVAGLGLKLKGKQY